MFHMLRYFTIHIRKVLQYLLDAIQIGRELLEVLINIKGAKSALGFDPELNG
jgi:hypothetical protein